MGKDWWKSRTLWANVVALVTIYSRYELGFDISVEETAAVLVSIGLFFRAITKEPLKW
ncbi:MAG: hypothetical protein DDT20_00879 [Firmicutes bacterium]|nr:hypothetical protein [Bacillota bacterium]MBT9176559.1 hypothetical protein [Bacillota bacterium]